MGENRLAIDKDGEGFVIYQLSLKQYLEDSNKLNDDLEKFYSLLIEKYSPTIEQLSVPRVLSPHP